MSDKKLFSGLIATAIGFVGGISALARFRSYLEKQDERITALEEKQR